MKKGVILNFKKLRVLDYVNLNKIFLLLCLLFTIGITVGCAVFSKNEWLADISKELFADYISIHNEGSFLSKFGNCFLKYFIFLFLYFVFGTSMLGVAIAPFLTIWQGILFAGMTSYLYAEYSLNGIAFNAIILIPPSIIFYICSFFAARESISFSLIFAKLTLPRSKPANIYIDFKKYCCKYLIFIAVTVFSVVTDIILNILLSNFFNFT